MATKRNRVQNECQTAHSETRSDQDAANNLYDKVQEVSENVPPDPQNALIHEFLTVRCDLQAQGYSDKQIKTMFTEKLRTKPSRRRSPPCKLSSNSRSLWQRLTSWTALVCMFLMAYAGRCAYDTYYHDWSLREAVLGSRCLVDSNVLVAEASRQPMNCSVCTGLNKAPVLYASNLTAELFEQEYAYANVPLHIKGATVNWTAMQTFSFQYFKKLYTETKDAFDVTAEDCQFFGYATEFTSLEDAMGMSDSRANFTPGEQPWYFGWSNCVDDIQRELRQHYARPTFLPRGSESSGIDWIFMGGNGLGANTHLDFVSRPSWQAQIRGRKTWSLVPVPECEHACSAFSITLEPGDIIVVDTNQWYHSTRVHDGDISICIGSEYD